ncbi:15679_t:CDS:2 [Funneliformis geosporum]|nr:15679_t:CDS:2 [Funneliformis geosporum]
MDDPIEISSNNFPTKKRNTLTEITSENQGFITASQLFQQQQHSFEIKEDLTNVSSKIPQVNIENVNIKNCNNVKVEVIFKALE